MHKREEKMSRNKGLLTAVLSQLLYNMIAQDNKQHLITTLKETAKACTAYAAELEDERSPARLEFDA